MTNRTYRIFLMPEDEGGFSVAIPTLPGCFTQGETIEEAVEMAREAVALYMESMEDGGLSVPDDNKTLEYLLTINS